MFSKGGTGPLALLDQPRQALLPEPGTEVEPGESAVEVSPRRRPAIPAHVGTNVAEGTQFGQRVLIEDRPAAGAFSILSLTFRLVARDAQAPRVHSAPKAPPVAGVGPSRRPLVGLPSLFYQLEAGGV